MAASLKIEEIEGDRLEECARLYVEVFNGPPWSEEWSVSVATARLQEIAGTPGFLGLGLVDETDIVGFILGYRETFVDGTDFYVKEMCVRTSRQRQGLGTTLLEHLKSILMTSGVCKLYLLTARDTSAAAFYTKSGFYVSDKMIFMGQWLRPLDK